MTDPADRPPLDLDAIRARADAATPGPWAHGDFDDFMGCGQVFTVHPDLMGGSIAAPSGDCYPRSGYDPQADMAFIANARHDIPALLAEVTALRAELDAARAERTEPATGEDVEVVAAAMWRWLQESQDGYPDTEVWTDWSIGDEDEKDAAREGARAILAALDLPGRERALREENERLRAEYRDLAAFAETAHGEEAWTDLMGRYTAARQERDDLKRRIAEGEVRLEGTIARLTAERDAANAERDNVTSAMKRTVGVLLDENNRLRSLIAEELEAESQLSDRFEWGGQQGD